MEIHWKYKFYQRLHQDSNPSIVCCLRMEEMVELHHLFVQRVIDTNKCTTVLSKYICNFVNLAVIT